MKRSVLKTVAVITAFIIGISVNNSCGGSYGGTMSDDPEIQKLWNALNKQAAEIKQLKSQVAALQTGSSGNGSNGGDGGEFFVDGLWFSRAGYVSSKPKNVNGLEYTYDELGRVKSYVNKLNGITLTSTYSYSDKKMTTTTTYEYDPEVYPNSKNSTTTSVSEYY